ncbi:hypothetical protein LCGC14_1912760, partial [marine sediment metagenome]
MIRLGDIAAVPDPFTLEENVNRHLGQAYFWWFLEEVLTRSFEGQTFTGNEGRQEPYKFSALHREWALLAQYNPRLCIQAPRAHLKTTVLGQGGPFWQMFKAGNNELVDGVYFSYKAELANEKVAALKRLIKTNPYCRYWKDLKPTAENIIDFFVDWGDGPVAEVVLIGSGIKSATRGRHPSYVICDDILSDFANPLASSELRLINRIFRQTIMSLPANYDDPLWLIGTPQAYDDILYQLAANEEWLWLVYPAVKDWGTHEVQWPEKYSYGRLMTIRKSVKPDAFEVEYQLLPVILTNQFLTREDLNQVVDVQLRPWNLEKQFVNAGGLGIYAGMDVGKEVHPTHIVFTLELPSGTLITLYQTFMDHLSYPEQVKTVNRLTEVFGLTRSYYDATFNVLDDRGLNQRWIGRVFTRKLKGDLATGLEKRVFADADQPGIVLLNDRRFLDQITMVKKDLKAVETPDGHADSFWSTALAVRAADDGPSFLDMGSVGMTRK